MDAATALATGQTSGNGGPPAQAQTEPPAAPGAGLNPADTAAPEGESTPESFKPVYDTQLEKRLQSPEIYAKLAATGGPKITNLADAYLKAAEELEQARASEQTLKARKTIPAADATPEEWDSFWTALGRPETDDGYKFDRTGEFSDLPALPGLDEKTKALFRRHNLPANVGESLWKEQGKMTLELMKAIRVQRETDAAQGLKDFEALAGRDAPRVRAELELVAKEFFGAEEWEAFKEAQTKSGKRLGNSAQVLMRLAGLRQYMTDSQIITGGGTLGNANPNSAEEAVRQAFA